MDRNELIERRKRMGLSQAALAKRLEITTRGYCNWESGARKIRKIHELALERVEQLRSAELKRDIAKLERQESGETC